MPWDRLWMSHSKYIWTLRCARMTEWSNFFALERTPAIIIPSKDPQYSDILSFHVLHIHFAVPYLKRCFIHAASISRYSRRSICHCFKLIQSMEISTWVPSRVRIHPVRNQYVPSQIKSIFKAGWPVSAKHPRTSSKTTVLETSPPHHHRVDIIRNVFCFSQSLLGVSSHSYKISLVSAHDPVYNGKGVCLRPSPRADQFDQVLTET